MGCSCPLLFSSRSALVGQGLTAERAKAWPRASIFLMPPAIGPRSPKPTSVIERSHGVDVCRSPPWGHSIELARLQSRDVSSAPQRRELHATSRSPASTLHIIWPERVTANECLHRPSRAAIGVFARARQSLSRGILLSLSRAAFFELSALSHSRKSPVED